MQDLISEGIARLAGVSSQAVFHLKQAMGGGKTHLLIGFGLLARQAELRAQYCADMPHAKSFDGADIAAFNGRNNPDHFFWGEIAKQLNKGDQFKSFWTSGPKAPDERDWLNLFDSEKPILILLDEMPPGNEDALFAMLRLQLGLADQTFFTDRGFGSLGFLEQQSVGQTLSPGFLKEHNPVVRHTVLRRRKTLEEAGLLEKVAVVIHPDADARPTTYAGVNFKGAGLLTNLPFDLAYHAAVDFTEALKKRSRASGFMKTLLLQRICSSFASGRSTAEKMLQREVLEDEEQAKLIQDTLSTLTQEEAGYLRLICKELSRPEARDPKLAAVKYFLTEHKTEGKTWLEHGCIIFSQYFDTVYYIGSELAKKIPEEPIGVYAGAGKSGIFRGRDFAAVEREDIKTAVKKREIRVVVATDAACEGLNLQTLGTLINVDLPWNPSRLEQRLGRIKRFGQARHTVDMLNLVYHETQDEQIYQVLSRRMKDRYDIFGSLPDTIEDEWIDTIEKLDQMMDEYIHLRHQARDVFEIRYQETIDPDKDRWKLCSRVLARHDVVDRLSMPW